MIYTSQRGGSFPVRGKSLGINGDDDTLAAKALGPLGDQLRATNGGAVHRDLVGPRDQDLANVLHSAQPAADGERNEHRLCDAAHHVEHDITPLMRGRDVKKDKFVGPLGVIDRGLLHRVAGIAQIHKSDALDDAPILYIQAGNNPFGEHISSWPPFTGPYHSTTAAPGQIRFRGTGFTLEATACAGRSLLDIRAILLYTNMGHESLVRLHPQTWWTARHYRSGHSARLRKSDKYVYQEVTMKPPIYVTRRLPEPALQSLLEVCEVEIWDQDVPPPYEMITEKLGDKDALLCLLTDRIDAALMDAAPGLKVISQCAVGYDNVDVGAATARGIPVGNTPGVLTDATADFTFTLMMAAARRIGEAIDYVREGHWQTWGLTLLLGQSVYGATFGIVGLGRIGQALARRARGFDMKILYYDAVRQPEAEAELGVEYRDAGGPVTRVGLCLTPCQPHRGDTRTDGCAYVRPDEADGDPHQHLARAGGRPRGAIRGTQRWADWLRGSRCDRPRGPAADHKLLELPNLIVAPHIASATVTSRNLMASRAVQNLIAGLRGEQLPYCVNPEVYG